MTKLMEKAIEKLRSLPEEKQDAVAGFVLSGNSRRSDVGGEFDQALCESEKSGRRGIGRFSRGRDVRT
jgi:hypothetical protein